MPADETQKWTSPHGHAIASSETDKQPKYTSDFLTRGQPDMLAEAVKVIEFYADINNLLRTKHIEQAQRARDFLAKIER